MRPSAGLNPAGRGGRLDAVFSSRSRFQVKPNALTRMLEKLRAGGREILDLTVSNPTRVGLDYPLEEIRSALDDPAIGCYHPQPRGLLEARQAVARYYRDRGVEVSPERVILTSGTSEAYSFLLKVLLDAGDRVLVPRPGYPLLEYLASLEQVCLDSYPLLYDGHWMPDLAELRSRMEVSTRALVVLNPNNPTGNYLRASHWAALRECALQHSLSIICDEVFFDYPLEEPEAPVDPAREEEVPTVLLNGLSKSLGLPQLKLSWMVLRGEERICSRMLERLELVADTFLSVGTPVQLALPRLLEVAAPLREQIRRRVRENLVTLRGLVADSPMECLRVEGGWTAVLRMPRTHSEEEWALLLLERFGVLVHPGYFYDFLQEPYLIVSLLVEPPHLTQGLLRLKQGV